MTRIIHGERKGKKKSRMGREGKERRMRENDRARNEDRPPGKKETDDTRCNKRQRKKRDFLVGR